MKPKVILITSPTLIGALTIKVFRGNPAIDLVGIIIDTHKSSNLLKLVKSLLLLLHKSGTRYSFYKWLLPSLGWMILRMRGFFKNFKGELRYVKDLNSKENCDFVRRLDCDYLCSCYSLARIGDELKNVPKKRCIVMHASLLPRYAGPEPALRMINNNDYKLTGATLFEPNNIWDGGDVLAQKKLVFNCFNHLMHYDTELWKEGAVFLSEWIIQDYSSKSAVQKKSVDLSKLEYQPFPSVKEVELYQKEHGSLMSYRYFFTLINQILG